VNDDDPLIDETLAGSNDAFDQLVRKYQDRLYNTIVHVMGSADDARDVVQEAFIQAYVKLDSFHRNAGFYTWLYRIAFNAAVSHQRRKRAVISVDQTRELSGHEPVDDGLGPQDRLEQSERVEQVRRALDALTDEHRTVLVLRELEECDYETIAGILQVPIGTVRSRLHRARLEMRDVLGRMLGENLTDETKRESPLSG
jgi:RNA polymerase sigma-70 factor (ECF subfamily)